MVQKKRPRRTRERILETSLSLFNRDGEPYVTTADIANEMNISPGNLYYHFRNKDDIIGELYGAFEAKVAPLLTVPEHRPPDVEDLWLLLHLLFERMREYRFFYRDLDEITSRNRRIAARFGDLTRHFEVTATQLCRGLVARNAMRATEREIAALTSNVVLVSTYWMSLQRIGRATIDTTADEKSARLGEAALQVLALIAPFLLGNGRALIEQLGEGYR